MHRQGASFLLWLISYEFNRIMFLFTEIGISAL